MKSSLTALLFIGTILLGPLGMTAEPSFVVPLDGSNDQLMMTVPTGYQLPTYSFGAVPSHASNSNPRGLNVVLKRGQVLSIYGPVLNTGPGLCLIECDLYATAPDFSLSLAALNVLAGRPLSDTDGSIATNQMISGKSYVGAWKTIEVYYDPQGDALAPVFQLMGNSNTAVTVSVYQIRVTPLKKLPLNDAIDVLHLLDPTPTVTPSPTPNSDVNSVSLTIRAYIDRVSDLHFKGNQLWYEHIDGKFPGNTNSDKLVYPTYINGIPWTPSWIGNRSDNYEIPDFSIPTESGYYYKLVPTRARGYSDLMQYPKVSNDYELIVQFDDMRQIERDWYEITLVRSSVPTASVASNQLYWAGNVLSYFDSLRMDLQGDNFKTYKGGRVQVGTWNAVFGSSLPNYSVNVSVQVLRGNVSVTVAEQPRPWNNFTAQIHINTSGAQSHTPEVTELLFSWSGEVQPEPTATPWPTANTARPSPTPVTGTSKVLWIVMDRAFPDTPNTFSRDDFLDFRDVFSQYGAESDWIEAGSQPITSELLSGYNAVIFGDTRTVPPLTDEETLAVLNFVRDGGSIFVIGQQSSLVIPDDSALYASSITRPFGIEFSMRVLGDMTVLESHPLLYRVSQLNGGGCKLIVKPPARALAAVNDSEVILAVADAGYGRVVAYSDEMLFFSNGSIWGGLSVGAHLQFAKNIAAWLLHQENLIGATPTPTGRATATLTPTENPETGSLTIRAHIDGTDELHIKGNQIWYKHFMWALPGRHEGANNPTIINGVDWYPTWSGDNSRALEWPETLIPEESGYYYQVNPTKSRGVSGLKQIPNAANDYELIITFDDGLQGGSTWYELTLTWSKVPPYTITPNQFYWSGTIVAFGQPVRMDLKGEQLTMFSDSFNSIATLASAQANPLPDYPVNLTVQKLSGSIRAAIVEQPRAENDWTAQIVLENANFGIDAVRGEFLFTWGDEVAPDPTSTPWPTMDPAQPSPTPFGESPKVLWVVMDRAFPDNSETFRYDFIEFSRIFERYGAENEWILAGTEPIASDLLSEYDAVVFGDTRSVPPLSAEEQLAVIQFVRGGGSIFVIGQQDSSSVLEAASIYATSITKAFGIQFSYNASGRMSVLEPHPLIDGVTELGGGGSKLLVEPPARAIAAVNTSDAILAVAEPGYGRVVAYSDEYQFFSSEINPLGTWYSYSNRRFAQNIAAWLLHKETLINATPTPPTAPHLTWIGNLKTRNGVVMEIHGDTATFKPGSGDTVTTTALEFSEPLPNYSVTIDVTVALGNAVALVQQQPRPQNDFTAKIILTQPDFDNTVSSQYVVVTWGNEVIPEPTATPWPTWNDTAPSPTPLVGAPRVLWIVRDGMFNPFDLTVGDNNIDFSKIFEQMGAVNTHILAGGQDITPALLNGYNAVIFGDTRTVDPLTPEEQLAVLNYVRGGGCILIIGQQDDRYTLDPAALYATSVGEPFGIQFSTSISGTYSTFASHPIVTGVYSISGAGGSKLIVSPPAEAIGWDQPNGNCILAVADVGYGRVVATSDEMMFFSKGSLFPGLSSNSHLKLATNIAAWLLHLENTTIPSPTPTKVPTFTPTPSLTPTFDPNASPTPTPLAINLLERYPTDLEEGDTEPGNAREWSIDPEDVYRLSHFHFTVGDQLDINVGEADVGIGKTVDGVVLAVVIPRNGGTLTSYAISEPEPIAHVWLRLHPKDILTLFPVGTVFPNGNTALVPEMQRIANIKIRNSWQAGGLAMLPPPGNYTVDCDLTTQFRRFFVVDLNAGTAEYIDYFANHPVPPPVPVDGNLAEYIFDRVWDEYDRQYAMFAIRPEVDWDALREEYRPQALEATTQYDIANILAEMLANLRDLHVWIKVGSGYVPVFNRPYESNVNAGAYSTILGSLNKTSNSVQWAITPDKIGFIAINGWSDSEIPSQVDAILEQMKNTKALIVDVRNNGGGSETLAQQVAGRFADQAYVYSYSQYRNGPNHDDLTDFYSRSVSPRGTWRYDKPVIVLIGQRCMSSNESFVAMMGECPQVTLMGDRTRGSSGNPTVLELPMDITVSLPRWIDYLPDKTPLDEHGVWPDVWFEPEAGAFSGYRDDLLSAALERLREETAAGSTVSELPKTGTEG